MYVTMLKSKIHRAVVTGADVEYIGSITIDKKLMDAAGILENEQVHVADLKNGNRLQTYVIAGPEGSGEICLNGAAAKLVEVGDVVIIMAYCQLDAQESAGHRPRVVIVNEKNGISEIKQSE